MRNNTVLKKIREEGMDSVSFFKFRCKRMFTWKSFEVYNMKLRAAENS
jgi:hypothetical protein